MNKTKKPEELVEELLFTDGHNSTLADLEAIAGKDGPLGLEHHCKKPEFQQLLANEILDGIDARDSETTHFVYQLLLRVFSQMDWYFVAEGIDEYAQENKEPPEGDDDQHAQRMWLAANK